MCDKKEQKKQINPDDLLACPFCGCKLTTKSGYDGDNINDLKECTWFVHPKTDECFLSENSFAERWFSAWQRRAIPGGVVKHSDFSFREHDTPEKECLQIIADVADDYDGFDTVERLKKLIDEMRAYAIKGLKGEWPYV